MSLSAFGNVCPKPNSAQRTETDMNGKALRRRAGQSRHRPAQQNDRPQPGRQRTLVSDELGPHKNYAAGKFRCFDCKFLLQNQSD